MGCRDTRLAVRTANPARCAGNCPISNVLKSDPLPAGSVAAFGEAGKKGLWGIHGTGPFRGAGVRVSSSAFLDWSPLLSVYSCSRAVVFLSLDPSALRRVEGQKHGGDAERAR